MLLEKKSQNQKLILDNLNMSVLPHPKHLSHDDHEVCMDLTQISQYKYLRKYIFPMKFDNTLTITYYVQHANDKAQSRKDAVVLCKGCSYPYNSLAQEANHHHPLPPKVVRHGRNKQGSNSCPYHKDCDGQLNQKVLITHKVPLWRKYKSNFLCVVLSY